MKATNVREFEAVDRLEFARRARPATEPGIVSCQMARELNWPYGHVDLLLWQIGNAILCGTQPWPVERTLLTTSVLEASMTARARGATVVPTPERSISYRPAANIPETAAIEPPFIR